MHDSTVFRDLAQHLEREARRFGELGYPEWAVHFGEDAARLLEHAQRLAEFEPPLPSIASLAGIDPGFRPAVVERGVCSECGATIGSGDDGPDCAQDVIDRTGSAGVRVSHGVMDAIAVQDAEQRAAISELQSEIERLRQQLDESEAALHVELTENPRHICPYRVEVERLRQREAALREALHRDKTGLAKALEEVTRLCNGYNWATVGRGPYVWDDDEYRAEFGRALRAIHTVAYKALVDSGTLSGAALRQGGQS